MVFVKPYHARTDEHKNYLSAHDRHFVLTMGRKYMISGMLIHLLLAADMLAVTVNHSEANAVILEWEEGTRNTAQFQDQITQANRLLIKHAELKGFDISLLKEKN